jgi:dipeptidyl aminopeptidase/acylaminoacyl peptidase
MTHTPDVLDRLAPLSGAPSRDFGDLLRLRAKRQRARKVGAFVVVAAIAVIAVVAMAAAWSGGGETSVPAVSPTQVPTQVATTTSFLDVGTGARTPNPAIAKGSANFYPVSPDGSMIAYSTFGSTDGSPDRVWVVNIDGTEKRAITPPGLDGYAPSWSPDGSTLVFQGRNHDSTHGVGQLYLADVATGELTRLTDLDPSWAGMWIVTAEISPDGRSVLFHLPVGGSDQERDLWTIPISGGTPTLLRKDAGYGSYGPDGTIVFVDHPTEMRGAIWLMDANGRNARMLTDGSECEWPEISPDGTRVAYDEAGTVYVVEIATGQITEVGSGTQPAWFDNNTLIVD